MPTVLITTSDSLRCVENVFTVMGRINIFHIFNNFDRITLIDISG